MRRIAILIIFPFFLSGCIYSIEFTPPYEPIPAKIERPLDISASLGDISSCFMKKCKLTSERELMRIDSVFVEMLDEENIFKDIFPYGSVSDLKIEIIQYPDLSSDIAKREKLYRDFLNWSLLGYITPLPYPFYMEVDYSVRISTEVEGALLILKEYKFHFKNTIRTASILGARYRKDSIQDQTIQYIAPMIFDSIKNDYEYYKKLEEIFSKKDFQKLKSLTIKL